jgi:hypothetical protein
MLIAENYIKESSAVDAQYSFHCIRQNILQKMKTAAQTKYKSLSTKVSRI